MTAYSFQRLFVPQVESGEKGQTVRGRRKRHARPGERVQLYTGMRTSACRKLVTPDPICTACDPIWMVINERNGGWIEAISINGQPLDDDAIEAFAVADGFGGFKSSARQTMGWWFEANHGVGEFNGVVIKWRPEA